MTTVWDTNGVLFAWDADLGAPYQHVVTGQTAINYGQEDGSALTITRRDARIDRITLKSDGPPGQRTCHVLDADENDLYVLVQISGEVEQEFDVSGEARALYYSYMTWTLGEESRDNEELILADLREGGSITFTRPRPD